MKENDTRRRKCVVCGARVRGESYEQWKTNKAPTCGLWCREILRTGKSRDELVREHSQIPEVQECPPWWLADEDTYAGIFRWPGM